MERSGVWVQKRPRNLVKVASCVEWLDPLRGGMLYRARQLVTVNK